MADDSDRQIRVMNFVSENQLDEAKRSRGERLEDGTAQRDRTLYEILKENKDKRDAEFNERFKHRPPKALDEDETEFLDKLEMSRREYEQQVADEEAEQIRSFKAAVAATVNTVQELKETSPAPLVQEKKSGGKKNPLTLDAILKVKPTAKKAKVVPKCEVESSETCCSPPSVESSKPITGASNKSDGILTGLVSYTDDSEDDS